MMVHFSGQTNCDRWPLQLGMCEIYVPDFFPQQQKLWGLQP